VIHGLAAQVASAWRTTGWAEMIAAFLAVLYLVLAIKQWRACWAAAFVSSCLYVWVLADVRLYMNAALNAFYAAMAVYGYWQWTRPAGGTVLQVTRWSAARNAVAAAAVVVLSAMSCVILQSFTADAAPFLDSIEFWASVFATFLVARKVYENWHWWFIIDSVSLCLYYGRGLYLTTLLFAAYLVMIVVGMREWRRSVDEPLHVVQPV
jgi:nicotinamide mononucleotide transporter